MTIRVGCSSTMVGLHLACEAIQRGDCSAAIVGGTNIIMSPFSTITMIEHGVLSPEASSKAFDIAADGYARAEAVNAVYLKKLDAAIRDGNPIRAVIRATSSNSDGKTAGLSNPSSEAREALIRRAYDIAGIQDYGETVMVECHGTGTPVGDTREANAIARVFGEKGIYIGSVKPNLGHSEGASGLTSLFKAVLSLENRIVVPNIKFNNPNPQILWAEAHLTVPVDPVPFPQGRRERISVNSFGLGGANAHAIVESAAEYRHRIGLITAPPVEEIPRLLVLSANHPDSLTKMIGKYREFVADSSVSRRDVAYTLGVRREHMLHKAFAVIDGSAFDISPIIKSNANRAAAFVFTGQGAQWPEMGKELMEHYDSFHADIKRMDESLAELKQAPPWRIKGLFHNLRPTAHLYIGFAY
jgi:acyl transferase domain-containing protein